MLKHVADLDAANARRGADVVLRRETDPVVELTVRASYRQYRPEEVTGAIKSGDFKVVLSPTGLDNQDWRDAFAASGGKSAAAPFDVDPRWPKRGDGIILDNRLRRIESVQLFRIDGEIVRLELHAQ